MPSARLSDPSTSHEAAASVADVRKSQAAVLGVLAFVGRSTDEQLVSEYAMAVETFPDTTPRQSPSGIRTRRHELVQQGLIADSGERVKMASGRYAVVWELA